MKGRATAFWLMFRRGWPGCLALPTRGSDGRTMSARRRFTGGRWGNFTASSIPFLGPGLLDYRYSMQAGEQGFEIRCRLQTDGGVSGAMPAAAPHRIVTTLTSRFGIQRIEAQLGNDMKMSAELIDPAVPPQEAEAFPPSSKGGDVIRGLFE